MKLFSSTMTRLLKNTGSNARIAESNWVRLVPRRSTPAATMFL